MRNLGYSALEALLFIIWYYMVNEITCFFNASVLYYEMLLRFDGRNQKRIAMISFFVQQFRTKVIFMKMRFCE